LWHVRDAASKKPPTATTAGQSHSIILIRILPLLHPIRNGLLISVWTTEGWLYLAIILDLFSRRIVGWAVSDHLKKDLALSALQRALASRQPKAGLLHHSEGET
jgi:transposase InsO family protein